MQEGFFLIRRIIVTGFKIEDTSVDSGAFQPISNTQHCIEITTDIVIFIHWVNSLDCLQKTLQCFLLSSRGNTVVEILQEV